MAKDYIVHDVMDLVITDLSTGKVMANTKLQMSSIESTISEEDIRGGIGNGKIYKMRSDKDLSISTRNAVMNNEWIALTQGVDIVTDKTVEVTKAEVICDIPANGEVVLQEEPKGKVTATKEDGSVEEFDATDKTVTLTGDFLDMEEVQLAYKTEIQGDSIVFDSKKYAKKVRLDLSTIAYDVDTGDVLYDIYFVFPSAMPSSELNLSFEAGTAIAPEISFDILQPRCGTEMGEMVTKARTTDTDTP